MTSEEIFAKQIKGYLDASLSLPEAKLARLKSARERALHIQRMGHSRARTSWFSTLGTALGASSLTTRILAPAAVVIVGTIGYFQWQQMQAENELNRQAAELADVDAALLKSELPIDAFLDVSFHSWLKRPAE